MNGISLESIKYMEFQMIYYRQASCRIIKSSCKFDGQAKTALKYQISHPAVAQYQKGKLPPINKALQILRIDTKEE